MFREQDLWCNLKLSVPADELLIGRSLGGVGFVCRKLKNCTIKEIYHENIRLSVIQIVNSKNILVTIIGVYLPYFTHPQHYCMMKHSIRSMLL